ncbi:transcriptional regulator, XRE family domain protein [Nocardiopsis alba ATCC BAA-2165]|uniref:Transcriptional regulator, XRE family domain protein n=1 Tax=Nocardiopsis alba (strain ATCC BAA-2165 / BE74) TaxID=1205910 RepID=J7LAW6_NOCAA|nr:transcriptional regulator, XRE family domain protein [Nocardiopsis alba ATCC BAA-2165]
MVYLIPDNVPVLSVSSSMQLYRLSDSKTVAASDHVTDNVVLEKPGEASTVESFVRDLIGLSYPRSQSGSLLEGMLHD